MKSILFRTCNLSFWAVLIFGVCFTAQHWEQIRLQWRCYLVSRCKSNYEAKPIIDSFLTEEDSETALRELVEGFGIGNKRFDVVLVNYVNAPEAKPEILERFSTEFAGRPIVLETWSRFWKDSHPDAYTEFKSIDDHFSKLSHRGIDRTISWNEILDLQALFFFSGRDDLALKLTPENWEDRFVEWKEKHILEIADQQKFPSYGHKVY